jgi:hypothetical protein
MLRGINRQDIFEDKEDYVRFLLCMQQMLEPYVNHHFSVNLISSKLRTKQFLKKSLEFNFA